MALLDGLVFVCFSVATLAVRHGSERQGGYFIFACDLRVLHGEESDYFVVEWKTFRLSRGSRSSVHCEVQAVSEALDTSECVKLFWLSCHIQMSARCTTPPCNHSNQSWMVIGVKAMDDAAQRDGITSFTDRRTGFEVLRFRERLSASLTTLRWVSSEMQAEFVKVSKLAQDPQLVAAKNNIFSENRKRPIHHIAPSKSPSPCFVCGRDQSCTGSRASLVS